MGCIHPAVSEICDPQSLDPICGKFDKFLAHGQAHIGQMGKWPWQCTTRGLDNSTELRMEKIRQAVTEIWVPQVWQPPARPPGPWRQYPSSPEGWGVKRCDNENSATKVVWQAINTKQNDGGWTNNKGLLISVTGDHALWFNWCNVLCRLLFITAPIVLVTLSYQYIYHLCLADGLGPILASPSTDKFGEISLVLRGILYGWCIGNYA